MGIADDLNNPTGIALPPKHGSRCSMNILLTDLAPEDRQALEDAMKSRMTGVDIADTLKRNGYNVGYWVVNRHRSGQCQCR